MIIEMIISYNCDYHHLLIMAGAQSAEDNHDYLDGYNIRYMIYDILERNKLAKSLSRWHYIIAR